jgi:trans-aconitate 2-methyltransferase
MNSITWDAARYERQPLPHEGWGQGVIDRAHLRAGESLIDAGCGTGRDAELALKRLIALADQKGVMPGRVTLLDIDNAMLDAARHRFLDYPDSVAPDVKQSNLSERWPVSEPADVIISVAALHWIQDHGSVFHQAAINGTKQARLHVDCGGAGNIAELVQAAGSAVLPVPVWNFATVDDTVKALRANGWDPQNVWLQADPFVLPDEDSFREFVSTVMFHSASELQLNLFVSSCPDFVIDYVRLNIDATRG